MECRRHPRTTVRWAARTLLLISVTWGAWTSCDGGLRGATLDLSQAVIVCPDHLSKPETKALDLLVEEVQKRTRIRWEVAHAWPADSIPVLAVGPATRLAAFAGRYSEERLGRAGAAEGYRIFI